MEQFIEDSSLEDWKPIGSGGFGQIYKARHRQWACDVAIKLLRHDDGIDNKSLLREIKMMQKASSPHVIRVRGVFKGRPPNTKSSWSTQLGVVMELMERGSLASLQEVLDGPPPWPLVFRLAHQVALGINFLHSLPRPVLHLDLKPHNVLLDDSLNAKLTDFGLARISCSVSVFKKDDEEGGGTVSYMPPEAFSLTYEPKRSSDIYSYGILLWSIATGKQPYKYARSGIVKLQVPEGQRPPVDDVTGDAAELTELMQRCWDNKPEQRPVALECTTETEGLYQKHKHAISDVVHEVLKKLDQKEKEDEGIKEQASESCHVEGVDIVDNKPTGPSPIQDQKEKEDEGIKEQASESCHVEGVDIVDNKPTGPSPIQDQKEKEDEGIKEQASESDRCAEVDVVGNIRKSPPPIQGQKMEMPREVVLGILEDLGSSEFNRFKWYLQQKGGLGDFPAIPKSKLENVNREDTVDMMFRTFFINTIKVTRIVLVKMDQNELAQKLS